MNEDNLIRTKWKNCFRVICKACGSDAEIKLHLNSDDLDCYFGEIYFKCDNCKSDRVYAANDADEIFSFGDIPACLPATEDDEEIKMPEHIARIICRMEEVCYNEGLGPDNSEMEELLLWISKNYPSLKEEYSYLNWP